MPTFHVTVVYEIQAPDHNAAIEAAGKIANHDPEWTPDGWVSRVELIP